MHRAARYVWLVLAILVRPTRCLVYSGSLKLKLAQIGLYLILNFTRDGRASTPALEPWNTQPAIIGGSPSPYWSTASNASALMNATILMLARNSEVDDAVRSVRDLEDKFNHRYNYPWVFLNEEEFSAEFKTCAHFSFHPVPRS